MNYVDIDLRLVSTPLTRAQKLAVCPLADVKAQARVSYNDEDALIESYIEAAYDFLSGPNGWLGRCCLLYEDWESYTPSAIGQYVELPLRPVPGDGVTAFEWYGGSAYSAVDAATYYALTNGTFARLSRAAMATWPYTGTYHPQAYRARFTAGFTPPDEPAGVPSPIVQSMRILAAHWFRHRETAGEATPEIAYGLKALCGRYRIGPDHC